MEPVKRKNLSEAVVEKIKRHIITRGLKPGDRLPTEQEMADQFGVSRIAVREATKALSFLGIISAAPRRGLTVGHVDMNRLTEYLGFHFAIGEYPKETLLKARIALETGALLYSAESMRNDSELYQRLVEEIHRHEKMTDLDEIIQGDIEFHRALVQASGLEPLIAFNDLLQVFFLKFRESVASAERQRGNRDHLRVIEALHMGNLSEAQEALRRHLEYHQGHL